MSKTQSRTLIKRLFTSAMAKTLGHIATDTLLTLTLLLALSVVHFALKYTEASLDFKLLFTSIHEWISLGTYMLLAAKGFFRIVRA